MGKGSKVFDAVETKVLLSPWLPPPGCSPNQQRDSDSTCHFSSEQNKPSIAQVFSAATKLIFIIEAPEFYQVEATSH